MTHTQLPSPSLCLLYLLHFMPSISYFNCPSLFFAPFLLLLPFSSFYIFIINPRTTFLPFLSTAPVSRSSGPQGLPIRWTNSCVWNERTAQARVFKCIFSWCRGYWVGHTLFHFSFYTISTTTRFYLSYTINLFILYLFYQLLLQIQCLLTLTQDLYFLDF